MSEQIARQFHEVYERLAPLIGYETRTDTKVFDPQSQNGRLMIAVCAEVVGELERERDEAREECLEQCKLLAMSADREEKLRAALQRLVDCDWVISLPDRMDAVRKIAREALQ